MRTITQPKPFLKWAGGKQALAPALIERFPREFRVFYEPFVGGGSVFFSLLPQRAVIGDLNGWLIDTYRALRHNWGRVASVLDELQNSKEEYLRIRGIPPSGLDLYRRAAHLIYLNKTCFRGLFRVNGRGRFNVPYGAYARRLYDCENLQAVASHLASVEMRHEDFEYCLRDIGASDFAYFDPPYVKSGGYADFNRYTAGQFRKSDHERLAAFCRRLDQRGIRWALSNSNTSLVRDLFRRYRVCELPSRREINLNAGKRNTTELLITNY